MTRRLLRYLNTIVALTVPVVAGAQDDEKVDVTGRWAFSVTSDVGSGSPSVTFKQSGDSISGRYSSQSLGERDFTGTIKDGKIAFSFVAEAGGQAFTMSFEGTLDGKDAMKGAIDFGGFGAGVFTARRVPPR